MALERIRGKRPGDTKNLIERLYITSMESSSKRASMAVAACHAQLCRLERNR
jgi:hypothetical protein